MTHSLGWMAAALIAVPAAAALAAGGLTPGNYVEVGDTIVDMLDTSALAYSTMLLGKAAAPRPVLATFTTGTAPSESFRTPCPGGGSVSGTIFDRDASGDVSVHDRFVTEFDACRIDNELVTGRSEFVIASHRVEQDREITELEFRFHDLGGDAMRWNGSARARLRADSKTGGERYTVTYQDLLVTRGAQTTRWSFTLDTQRPPLGDRTTRISGSMTLDHAVLRLAQDEAFVIAPGGKPRSGRLTATDADGDRLEIEAGRRRYRYRFFGQGNAGETPDAHSQSKPHGGF